MAPTYRTKAGYTVEVVQLSDTSGNHDGEWLRVRYHGFHVADVRSVAELERYFPLGELEADALARRCGLAVTERYCVANQTLAHPVRPDGSAARV